MRCAVGVNMRVCWCGRVIMLVSSEFVLTANIRSVVGWGGHGLDVCLKTKKTEYWRIVLVYIFLIIAS